MGPINLTRDVATEHLTKWKATPFFLDKRFFFAKFRIACLSNLSNSKGGDADVMDHVWP
jgi:hypothetical protein